MLTEKVVDELMVATHGSCPQPAVHLTDRHAVRREAREEGDQR